MAGKGRGRIRKRSDGKWMLYLPTAVCDDTHFPFTRNEQVKVTLQEDKSLRVESFTKFDDCPNCHGQGELQETDIRGVAEYKCKCGEEWRK
ncbi:MAG: hypothetical protein OEY81_00675 [Candidatus Bathyarchaeota archaeon]|nr:hypothetical protein [Candidatus Bathyarchaeota archaeon]